MFIPACSSESNSTRQEMDASSPVGDAPTEGTIIFSDPKPKAGASATSGRRLLPTLIKITTEEAKPVTDSPVPAKSVGQEVIKRTRGLAATVVSPQAFAEIWSQLEKNGVFKLPRHRGGTPPEDRASISLITRSRTLILLQPPTDSESFKSLYESWIFAKNLIATSM